MKCSECQTDHQHVHDVTGMRACRDALKARLAVQDANIHNAQQLHNGLRNHVDAAEKRALRLRDALETLTYEASASCPPNGSPLQDAIDGARAALKESDAK